MRMTNDDPFSRLLTKLCASHMTQERQGKDVTGKDPVKEIGIRLQC